MSALDDRLSGLKAALRAYWLSLLESQAKYGDLESEVNAALDVLRTMTPGELEHLRTVLRADLQTTATECSRVWGWAELKAVADATLECVLPESLLLATDETVCRASASEAAEKPTQGQRRGGECQRCNRAAVFHITEIVGEEPIDVDLCEEHAREYLTGGTTS